MKSHLTRVLVDLRYIYIYIYIYFAFDNRKELIISYLTVHPQLDFCLPFIVNL